jgi:hypothetical protein
LKTEVLPDVNWIKLERNSDTEIFVLLSPIFFPYFVSNWFLGSLNGHMFNSIPVSLRNYVTSCLAADHSGRAV